MEVWEYLLTGNKAQSQYADGLNSVLGEKQLLTADELRRRKNKMRTGMVRRMLFKLKKLRDREFMKRKISELFTGKK